MNSSRNQRLRKYVLTSWVIIAGISLTTGTVIGSLTNRQQEVKAAEETADKVAEAKEDIRIFTQYGSYDSYMISSEPKIYWKNDDFKALDIPLDEDLQCFTYELCNAYDIDYIFILAVMETESNYQPDLISAADDYGLMQINRINHKQLQEKLGITDFLDPYQNIRAGCYTMRKLFEKYQKPELVLMAYNMGEGGAKKLWKNGVYSSNYSEKVMKIQKKLEEMDGN